jgi:hypothetical protein
MAVQCMVSLEGDRPLSLLSQVRKVCYSGNRCGSNEFLGEAIAPGAAPHSSRRTAHTEADRFNAAHGQRR